MTTVAAANFQGADAVLRKVAEESAIKQDANAPADEHGKLREDLIQFRKKAGSLPPAEAAKGWLELVDRRAKLAPDFMRRSEMLSPPVRGEEVIVALPPPAAWAELKKAVEARPAAKGPDEIREIGLRLLVSTLNADVAGRAREVAALQAKAEKADARAAYSFRNTLQQIGEAMLATLDDPEAVLKSLERQLAVASPSSRSGNMLRVPNLVMLVGAAKAEEFLRRALVQENVELAIQGQNETSQLAQKLALELVDQLKNRSGAW